MLNKTTNGLGVLLLKIVWGLNLVHVPLFDNTPSPYLPSTEPEPTGSSAEEDNEPLPEPTVIPKTVDWGHADPTQVQRTIQVIEELVEEEGTDGAWYYSRFDGIGDSFNYKAWHHSDDVIIAKRRYTERTKVNYIKVRPLVIEGKTNLQIAKVFGKGKSWAEDYAGAVRAAFYLRMKVNESPSPTE